MDFCWATDNVSKWDSCCIFHNAGVVQTNSDLFFKGNFTNSIPYDFDDTLLNKETCSYKYFEIIKSIGKNSCIYGTI